MSSINGLLLGCMTQSTRSAVGSSVGVEVLASRYTIRKAIPAKVMPDALFALDELPTATEDYPNVDALLKAIGEALATPPPAAVMCRRSMPVS